MMNQSNLLRYIFDVRRLQEELETYKHDLAEVRQNSPDNEYHIERCEDRISSRINRLNAIRNSGIKTLADGTSTAEELPYWEFDASLPNYDVSRYINV